MKPTQKSKSYINKERDIKMDKNDIDRRMFKAGKFTGEGFEKGMQYQLPSIEKVAGEYSALTMWKNETRIRELNKKRQEEQND